MLPTPARPTCHCPQPTGSKTPPTRLPSALRPLTRPHGNEEPTRTPAGPCPWAQPPATGTPVGRGPGASGSRRRAHKAQHAHPKARAAGPGGRGGLPGLGRQALTTVFTARYIRAPKVWASLPRTSWSSPKRSKVTTGLQHRTQQWCRPGAQAWLPDLLGHRGTPGLDGPPHLLTPHAAQSHKGEAVDRRPVTLQGRLVKPSLGQEARTRRYMGVAVLRHQGGSGPALP